MDSYNFTYKDVIKRHERMINRVEKWEIHALAIIMLVVTAFFTFSTFCFASEESIQPVFASYWAGQGNVLQHNDSALGYYFPIEAGHTYTIDFNLSSDNEYLRVLFTTETPSENVDVYDFRSLNNGTTSYTFNAIDNGFLYCYIYTYNYFNNTLTINSITDISSGMNDSVNSLVDNVGVSQIWDIFGNGIDYIYVVVIVAFGIFLIAFAIRKISKGKSEF